MVSPLCLDASVVVRLVTGFDLAGPIHAVLADANVRGRGLVAPALFGFELANALHRYAMSGTLTAIEAREALEAGLALDVDLVHGPALHLRALDIARHLGMTAAYDAHYLAAAEARAAALVTVDQRLASAAERLGIPRIHVPGA